MWRVLFLSRGVCAGRLGGSGISGDGEPGWPSATSYVARKTGHRPQHAPFMRDGRWSAAVPTDRATDPQQVDMPARDKEGVSSGHTSSITCAIPFCPESFSPPSVVGRQRSADAHAKGQPGDWPGYSRCRSPFWPVAANRAAALFAAYHPGLIQLAEGLRRLGRRQMLAGRQVPPRAFRVAPATARLTNHAVIAGSLAAGKTAKVLTSGGRIRPHLPGASCAGARRRAHPHSSHPRCHTSQAGTRRS